MTHKNKVVAHINKIVVILCWVYHKVHSNGNEVGFCFDGNNEGHRLDTSVLKNLHALSGPECVLHCLNDQCCRSVNYHKRCVSPENETNCELLHGVVAEQPGRLKLDENFDHLFLLQPQRAFNCRCLSCADCHIYYEKYQNCSCQFDFDGNKCRRGISCLDLKNKGLINGDGEYIIDPDGEGQDKEFVVYCDMTSFGGGWTMCYTTDNHVNMKTELTTTAAHGYRANCNKIPFTEVIFIDQESKQNATFKKSGSAVTFDGNYNKRADTYGLWMAQGVALQTLKYQMLICDTSFYKGLHLSGYTGNCYKQCHSWCGDTSSPYFRTAADSNGFSGVAFNENGHRPKPIRTVSVGIR